MSKGRELDRLFASLPQPDGTVFSTAESEPGHPSQLQERTRHRSHKLWVHYWKTVWISPVLVFKLTLCKWKVTQAAEFALLHLNFRAQWLIVYPSVPANRRGVRGVLSGCQQQRDSPARQHDRPSRDERPLAEPAQSYGACHVWVGSLYITVVNVFVFWVVVSVSKF